MSSSSQRLAEPQVTVDGQRRIEPREAGGHGMRSSASGEYTTVCTADKDQVSNGSIGDELN